MGTADTPKGQMPPPGTGGIPQPVVTSQGQVPPPGQVPARERCHRRVTSARQGWMVALPDGRVRVQSDPHSPAVGAVVKRDLGKAGGSVIVNVTAAAGCPQGPWEDRRTERQMKDRGTPRRDTRGTLRGHSGHSGDTWEHSQDTQGTLWDIWGHCEDIWGHPGDTLGYLGILRGHWGTLWDIWGHSAGSWGHPGDTGIFGDTQVTLGDTDGDTEGVAVRDLMVQQCLDVDGLELELQGDIDQPEGTKIPKNPKTTPGGPKIPKKGNVPPQNPKKPVGKNSAPKSPKTMKKAKFLPQNPSQKNNRQGETPSQNPTQRFGKREHKSQTEILGMRNTPGWDFWEFWDLPVELEGEVAIAPIQCGRLGVPRVHPQTFCGVGIGVREHQDPKAPGTS